MDSSWYFLFSVSWPGSPWIPNPIALENPGNTWNSRSISPKLLQVPRHQINSFTFSFIILFFCVKKETKVWTLAIAAGQSAIASTNLLWPRGRDLSACRLQTDTWKGSAVREASVRWRLRPKTPSGKAVKSPCSCCPGPEPFNFFGALKLTCPQFVSLHSLSSSTDLVPKEGWLINARLSCSAHLFVPLGLEALNAWRLFGW